MAILLSAGSRQITRRELAAATLTFAAAAKGLSAGARITNTKAGTNTKAIGDALRVGLERRGIPCVTAVVAKQDAITYKGAFGKRDSESGVDVKPNSIFAIASMTKALTSTAALQLVEQGKLNLHEPVSKHLPQLANIQVLSGYNSEGKAVLRPPRTPITLKHLLTHTSGFCYDNWSDEMVKWEKSTGQPALPAANRAAPLVPLMFDPGVRWHYGYSTDWTGKLVEAVSGVTLEQYFQRNILQSLGMTDTSFILTADKFERLVTGADRQPGGPLKPRIRAMPAPPLLFNGGGGLYSTAEDYIKFTQMILRRGRGPKGEVILRPKTVAQMTSNQIGDLTAGRLKTEQPERSSDVDLHPGAKDGWGLGFLINRVAYPGGRSAGSLAWAGLNNTFYWIDPKQSICAVIMMQFLPFVDKEAVGMLTDFEHAVYAA